MSDKTMEWNLEKICDMKEKCVDALYSELCKGIDCVDTKEAGEVADMIQDFAKAEKYCREAAYYKAVTDAMNEKDEYERYGYNSRHYKNGRFAPAGYKPYLDQEPYIYEYLNDPDFESNMRMGYPMNSSSSRYGRVFDGYRNAKRHYTENKSHSDKMDMEKYSKEYLNDTIDALKEMWSDADVNHRKHIKEHLVQLVDTMTI